MSNFSELEDDDDDTEGLESRHEQSEKDKYLGQMQTDFESETQTDSNQSNISTGAKRVKRQSDYEYTPTKTRCPLLLVADYRFFQEMGASNTKTTISYLVSKCTVLSQIRETGFRFLWMHFHWWSACKWKLMITICITRLVDFFVNF